MKNWKILVVDDEKDVHDVTRLSLKHLVFKEKKITLLNAYSAQEAKKLLEINEDIALVLLDVVMEDEDAGLNLVHFIRKELRNEKVQIIIRTGHPGHAPVERVTYEYDVNDYQEKSELTSQKLKISVVTALRAFNALDKVEVLYKELETSQYDLFFALGQIAETRSQETGNHVKRVGEISKILALSIGKTLDEAEKIKMAASMHDIGKMAIQDSILNKPGQLTHDEFEVMKTHSIIGYEMLESSKKEVLKTASIIAKEHHENFDGSGYPYGLSGENIHLDSRIVAVADVFDALGNKRVYKDPWELEEILRFMSNESGKKFDPMLIDKLFENVDILQAIREKYPD